MTSGPGEDGAGRLTSWVRDRVAGSVWWYRVPVLVVLGWILWHHLRDPMYSSIFYGINLGFHEMGHALFSWSDGRVLTAAGGTILELAVPLAAGAYLLLEQRDPFGATVCLFWAGTVLVGTGMYAADARAQALPLVSPFGPVDVDSHDWTVILMKYGRLSQDQQIGGLLRSGGLLAMGSAIGLGAWVLRVMARS